MTLDTCISLALKQNRTIKNAYLDRVAQKYDLRVAEDKFVPTLVLTPSVNATGNTAALGGGARTGNTNNTTLTSGAGAALTENLPAGGNVSITGNYTVTSTEQLTPARDYGWNISLTQPFLKGAGFDVNLESVRAARVTEQQNILSLKSTLISTLTSVITSYRSYVQAVKSLEITRQSLERSRELVATNRELIAAGRMAAIEIVQSEADLANQEFQLLSAENSLDAARLALTKAIDIDKNTRLSPMVETEIQDALRSAEMNYRQIKLATQARVLSEKKVEIETEKLKAGRSTNFQLVSYQNDLKNAQNNELSAIITYLNALSTLESSLGITLDRWGVTLSERQ